MICYDMTDFYKVIRVKRDNMNPEIIFFSSKYEYEEWMKEALEEQQYTGLNWISLYTSKL